MWPDSGIDFLARGGIAYAKHVSDDEMAYRWRDGRDASHRDEYWFHAETL